jgi:hypothetical protein
MRYCGPCLIFIWIWYICSCGCIGTRILNKKLKEYI